MSENIVNQNSVLPKNISDILDSEYQRVLSYKIRNSFKLLSEDISVIEETVDKLFYGSLNLVGLKKYLQDNLKTPNLDINALSRDIIGLRLYIATGYFKEHNQDVKKYLEDSGGVSEKYLKNVEQFTKALSEEDGGTFDYSAYLYDDDEKPKITTSKEDDEPTISEIDLTEEDRELRLKKFFENGLGEALELEDKNNNKLLETINDELVYFLVDSTELKNDLSSILFASQILIGQDNIIIDEKNLPPTGANWIKDFYRTVGSENFDSLAIAKYIITSLNAKKLKPEAQTKLRKFLNLYHNIKYFPAPFSAIPIESWEIIPGSRHGDSSAPATINKPNIEKSLASVAPIYTKPVEKIATITPSIKKAPQPKLDPTPVVKEVVKPIVKESPAPVAVQKDDSEDLIELKNMLLQYPVGSLERAAIEEEIKTLEKN